MYRISPFIRHFALALGLGAGLATLWVNLSPESYYDAIEFRLLDLVLPGWIIKGALPVTALSLLSGVLMPLFFFVIGKEFWEALVIERGPQTFARHPVLALGMFAGSGMGAVVVWLVTTALLDPSGDNGLRAGWPVGLASDVVICFAIGRLLFGPGHPALHFVLLLTVAQDVVGLCIGAVSHAYGSQDFGTAHHPGWILLSLAAPLTVWLAYGRLAARDKSEVDHRRAGALWPYLLAGGLTWAGFALGGLPPELGLLPLIPAIPRATISFGLFAEAETLLHDPLNRLTRALTLPLIAVLFLFGLTRCAIELAAFGPATQAVIATFWLGKPLGLLAGAALALTFGGGRLPAGIRLGDLVLIALVTATGAVVPLTVLDLTLMGGFAAAEARLGLILTLLAAPLALLLAQVWRQHDRSKNADNPPPAP